MFAPGGAVQKALVVVDDANKKAVIGVGIEASAVLDVQVDVVDERLRVGKRNPGPLAGGGAKQVLKSDNPVVFRDDDVGNLLIRPAVGNLGFGGGACQIQEFLEVGGDGANGFGAHGVLLSE